MVQDSVAQSLTGNGSSAPDIQAQTGRPDDATMPQSAVPPASPGAPTSAPANQQQPTQEPQPPALIHPNHRSFFGAVASALVGGTLAAAARTTKAVAGPQPPQYTTDASGRVIRDPNQRLDTTSSRLERIARAALEGLAAGAMVPSGPNRGAQALRGIGAGFEAQQNQGQQQDLLQRQQAQQEYETQEKAKTDNAVRAMHLASTYSLWSKAMLEQADHDPERQKNMDVMNAANDYISRNPGKKMSVDIVSPEQYKAIHDQEIAALKNDPTHSTQLSVGFPLGTVPAKDENGQPLFNQDGTPKMVGQVAVIRGGDKVPLPQSFIDDAREYGSLAGIGGADRLTAGQEVPITQFLTMDAKLNQAKRQEIDGWKPANGAHVLRRADGSEVLINGFNGSKTREAPKTDTTGTPNLDVLEKELDKGVAGDRAAQISAALGTVLRDPTASEKEKDRARIMKARADAQATAAVNYAGRKAGAEAGLQGQQKMWDEGQNPYSGEKLNLSNAPDAMMVDRNGQPIPFKMLSTMKPTQQENNRADFAKSTLHILDIVDGLRQRGKLPNGPITGVTAKTLAKFGLGSNSQEAIDLIGFAQSASTGAHVGGRFNVPIMQKMDTMLNMNMNDEQFLAAEQGIRDVMQPYAESGGRITVGEYKYNLIGSVQVLKDGRRVKVTGFDKNGNIVGTQVR